MIQVLKVLVSVIWSSAWPINGSIGKAKELHCSLGAGIRILDTEGVGKKTLGITRATALHRLGTAALREVTCPVIFMKRYLSG